MDFYLIFELYIPGGCLVYMRGAVYVLYVREKIAYIHIYRYRGSRLTPRSKT